MAIDANGAISRVALDVGVGTINNGALNLLDALLDPSQRSALAFGIDGHGGTLVTDYGDRCPGSMECGAEYYPESGYAVQPERTGGEAMRRALASTAIAIAVAAVIVIGTGAASAPSSSVTYKVELDNAFGLVTGADFKVAGVPAGSITNIALDQKSLNAVVTVSVNNLGLARFHTSATCDSEPQSLIGEYFISCEPGTTGPLLKTGAMIPVSHTTSTIPADLLLDVLRVPEQQRLPLIIDSLGAGVAARSGDIQAALDRAVPALRDTDNLLSLLANDSSNIESLTSNADSVVTALANNSQQVQRFITYADRAARATATQHQNLQSTLKDLPAFLEQLRPAMKQLGAATESNTPVLANLHSEANELDTFFTQMPAFSKSSIPAIKALGKASVTGRQAVIAAKPTVTELEQLRGPHARAGKEPVDRPTAHRQPEVRDREERAQPRWQGLLGSRGAAAVRLQPRRRHQLLRP